MLPDHDWSSEASARFTRPAGRPAIQGSPCLPRTIFWPEAAARSVRAAVRLPKRRGGKTLSAPSSERRPAGYQRWRDLLFVHWPVPPDVLRSLVPDQLEIDRFAGRAYVSLIPFVITYSLPAGAPPALATRFLETNLRTYVRSPDGEPGVYFFSLEASSLLAVAAARLLFGLPYFPAAMSIQRAGSRVEYASRRRGPRGVRVEVTWSIGDLMDATAIGTEDHFLIERYNLYVARRRRLYRGQVRHLPYPLRQATVETLQQTVLAAAGLTTPIEPPLCHYSPGVDVDIFWLERAGACPG